MPERRRGVERFLDVVQLVLRPEDVPLVLRTVEPIVQKIVDEENCECLPRAVQQAVFNFDFTTLLAGAPYTGIEIVASAAYDARAGLLPK